MRVAALYDIHGNVAALEAVLAEVARERPDAIVVGGDVVAGPSPRETLALLESSGDVRFVRGNADRELVDGGAQIPDEMRDWIVSRVDDAMRKRLASWPLHVTLDVGRLGQTLFCHATPRSDEEIFTALTPDEVVDPMFDGAPPLVVVGHTHMQADRRVGGRRIVNAGSVGMPYEGRRGAYWALLGDTVSLRRTDYDVAGHVAKLRAEGCPVDAFFRESLIEPRPRDAVARFFEDVAASSR